MVQYTEKDVGIGCQTVSHRDHARIRDEKAAFPINLYVFIYVIFQQQHVPIESQLLSLKSNYPNPILK